MAELGTIRADDSSAGDQADAVLNAVRTEIKTAPAPATPSPGTTAPPVPSADSANAPTSAATPEGTPPEPESPDPTPDGEVPGEPAPEVQYRADGQDYTLPGSAVGDDGIFIPHADGLSNEVLRLLAHGRVYQGSFRQRLSEADQTTKREAARADGAETALNEVLTRLDQMIETGEIEGFLSDRQARWAQIKAESLVKAEQARAAEDRRQLDDLRAQQEQSQLGPKMEDALEQTIRHFGQKSQLDREAMVSVFDWLSQPEFRGKLFVKAPEDDPVNGTRKGDWLIDYGMVERAVQHTAKVRPSGRVQEQKAAAAAKANAKAPAKTPPTVGARTATPPAPGPKVPVFASAEEADEFWLKQKGYRNL